MYKHAQMSKENSKPMEQKEELNICKNLEHGKGGTRVDSSLRQQH